jgi:hypothetical protein
MESDYGFPVRLGQDVSRHSGRWMWRIEVPEPDTMAAAWFTHENLSAILGTDFHDAATVRKLVQWRRDEIQECISIAWMEHCAGRARHQAGRSLGGPTLGPSRSHGALRT